MVAQPAHVSDHFSTTQSAFNLVLACRVWCLAQPDGEAARVEERKTQVSRRRILQLGNFDARLAFVMASQMARQGRLGLAARMMRDIAPLNYSDGFGYAYFWWADYAMLNWKGVEPPS